jgi:hypothetical protein
MKNEYTQHEGKVIENGKEFKHVMALAIDPTSDYKKGIVRCITSRLGDVSVKGFADRSELHKISSDSLYGFSIGEKLIIENEAEVVATLVEEGGDFIGLEDPDIYIDSDAGLTHVYFTIPVKYPNRKTQIHLGHAVGKNLDSLKMTEPVLKDVLKLSAKELSVAPVNSKGFRYNLVESRGHDEKRNTYNSIVQVAIAKNMAESWSYGDTAFHPKDHSIAWIAEHASPGPLFPRSFIDVGPGKLLGVLNGREASKKVDDKIMYGMFSVGLFIYDYENGKIDWVSPEPFIQDSEARTITFASQFVETGNGEGVLYAHVDDSFVRAYDLSADLIKPLLP